MQRFERLKKLIDEYGCKRIAEIGVRVGETSEYLLNNCNLEKYYLVDKVKQHDIEDSEIVKNLTMTSDEASLLISKEGLDLVFIDADHEYGNVISDLERWYLNVKDTGIVSGHDYKNPTHRGVEKAVDEFFKGARVEEDLDCNMFWIKKAGLNVNCDSSV